MKGFLCACTFLCATSLFAQSWRNRSTSQPFAEWNEVSNWDSGVPNGAGATATIHTQGAGKFITLRSPITLGVLQTLGTDQLPMALLSEDQGRLQFKPKQGHATILYERESRDLIDLPMAFEDSLCVVMGPSNPSKRVSSSLYFGPKTLFQPCARTEMANLTFDVRSKVQPWVQTRILEQRTQNVIEGYLEDGEDGTPLRLHKKGIGTLSLACSDNGYSGGTEVHAGVLCAVNTPALASPILSLGTGKGVMLSSPTSEVALVSSLSGTWGPEKGYDFFLPVGGTISFSDASAWDGQTRARGETTRFEIGALHLGSGTTTIRPRSFLSTLLVRGESTLSAPTTTLCVKPFPASPWHIPTLVLKEGWTAKEDRAACSVRKTGWGLLELHGEGRFSGGFTATEGTVSVGRGTEFGTGPVEFREHTALLLREPAFRTVGPLVQKPGSVEIWNHECARFSAGLDTPEEVRMADGVHLFLRDDLANVENKRLVMAGGSLAAWRTMAEPDHQTHLVGPGITIATTADLRVGTEPPNVVTKGRGQQWLRNGWRHPLDLRGPIEEERPGCALLKIGEDTVVLRGRCSLTGGTTIERGTLFVEKSGRLGSGPIHIRYTGSFSGGKPMGEARLRLRSSNALPSEEMDITLGIGGVLELAFEGELVVKSVRIMRGEVIRTLPPGLYDQSDDIGLEGPGTLVVTGPLE